MLLTSLALAISLQSSGETLTAIRNDDPETWTVEYPRVLRPFVVEYRQCLNVSDRRVTGEADFEVQHRADIPRCAETLESVVARSNETMASSKTRIGPEEVDQLFRDIGLIHVARGRDFDQQFRERVDATIAGRAAYEENKPKGLVLDLVDGSVVQARADLERTEDEAGAGSGQSKGIE
ncbi:MAG: hypothetical protein QNI87_08275 [Erythrobacter sp.]|uniref:hypothetical protein n=1 Tax=Erythrobacter sp. TaxID=1042 RepID=UPI002621DC4D|nr:hypothetical protein [Erythrobacter sp.]MDJ0978520.1 hypothetical protein [Erythrobacter sp.]